MKRVKLTVSYDGTNYCGWQLQSNGITIEEVLNKALLKLLGEPVAVIGASRTDSGVHAIGNVAVFDTENRMPADKICFALNQRLPEDIRIQNSKEVALSFHPRKHNCIKTYEYKILNRKIDMPVSRLYTHFCYVPLDEELMRQGAAFLLGEHDFKSFCTVRSQTEETVRTIYSINIERQEDLITLRISGSGFLYNMVRIIAGTLMKVGMKAYPPEHVKEIVKARDRGAAGPTAIAKGLTLVSLEYEKALPPVIEVQNDEWQYTMIQKEIAAKKKAYLVIRHCRMEDWDRLLMRNIHQAARNGADYVYICSKQDDGMVEEKNYGFYPVKYVYDIVKMEMDVPDVAAGVPEQHLYEAAVKKPVEMDERLVERLPEKQAGEGEIQLETITLEEAADFLNIYGKTFFNSPNSSSFTLEDVTEKIEASDYILLWLLAEGGKVGFVGLSSGMPVLEIDMLGTSPEYQGKGYGKAAMKAITCYARSKGYEKMELKVVTSNHNAVHIYHENGFVETEITSHWFMAENNRKNN